MIFHFPGIGPPNYVVYSESADLTLHMKVPIIQSIDIVLLYKGHGDIENHGNELAPTTSLDQDLTIGSDFVRTFGRPN